MEVDVWTDVVIGRHVAEVAAYACDPDNAPAWYANIRSVEWQTPPPLQVGSRIGFVAHFLGRRLTYTYEVIELDPRTRLTMRTTQGPFPMQTTYAFEAVERGTRMTLRNYGKPAGFCRLAAPFMALAVRRANEKDLKRLRGILENEIYDPDLGGLRLERRGLHTMAEVWHGTVAGEDIALLIEADLDGLLPSLDVDAQRVATRTTGCFHKLEQTAIEYLHAVDSRPWGDLRLRVIEVARRRHEWIDWGVESSAVRDALKSGAIAVTLRFSVEGDRRTADVVFHDDVPIAWDYR